MRTVVTANEASTAEEFREALLRNKHSGEISILRSEEVVDRLIDHRPDVVFLLPSGDLDGAVPLIQEIRDVLPARVVVVGPEAEAKIVLKLMRDGAYHYLNRHEAETELGELLNRLQGEPPVAANFGRIISILGAGGGSGATTLAVNIGAELAAQGKRAALLDLRLCGGDAATLLDLQPANSIVDFCRHLNRIDDSMFERCLARHPKGLHLLAAPRDYSEISQVTVRGVRRAVNMARRTFDYVLIDLDSGFRTHDTQALLQSDVVLVVLRLDFTSIRRTQRVLDYLKGLKIEHDQVRLIVNRFRRPREMRVRDVEKVLGRQIAQFVPEDGKRVNAANNGGVPVILQFPRAPVSKSLQSIAASVNGQMSSPGKPASHPAD